MSIVLPIRVAETTITAGTGSLTLAGVVDSSHRSFADHYGAGTSWLYYMIEWDGGFEYGRGSFNGTDTLTRAQVLRSSNADALVNLPAGSKTVFALLDLGEPEWGFTGAMTAAQVSALPGAAARFTGGSPQTVALPAVATLPRGFAVTFINAGSANLTLDPDGSETIGGASTLVLTAGQRCIAVRRASGWEAVGPWASVAALNTVASEKVPLDGSTAMSGNLTISKSSPVINLNDTAGGTAALNFQRSGTLRWRAFMSNDAESGSNTGSTFFLTNHSDAGSTLSTAIQISRTTGVVTFGAIPVGPASSPSSANQLSRKQYVDDVAATKAPFPQASSGVGQFQALTSTTGGAAVLPSGGTWAYAITRYYLSWAMPEGAVGIAAGGSTVGSVQVDTAWRGWCWRIA